jgi:hypothetical protein
MNVVVGILFFFNMRTILLNFSWIYFFQFCCSNSIKCIGLILIIIS